MKVENICNHSFLGDHISYSSSIVDCGVNQGDFSSQISKKFHCKIYGLEPDPRLFSNLPKLDKCAFHQLAVADRRGTMHLHLGDSQCSSLLYREQDTSQSTKVETISLPEFCSINGIDKIDLLKLDIEGAEIQVFYSLNDEWIVDRIGQITVEFHEFLDQSATPEIEKIISRLKRLGFYYLPFSRTFADILFVNRSFIKLSPIELLRILTVKYARGISRIISRHV